jgi:hypothetical protein
MGRGRGAALPLILLGLAVGALPMIGCAPQYEPIFRLELPPTLDSAGRQCLAACEDERARCEIEARHVHAACADRALLVEDQCRANALIDYQICQRAFGPDGRTCFQRICQRPVCGTAPFDRCDTDHRRCFAACGGTVVEGQRCVANCPS